MATYIHGIAASENIDSSGERLLMSGLDISSLPVDGIFNYEHKSDSPDQIVGKVLKAKKIFSEKDCDDDHQLYFWNRILTPYLYVMGELFDDYKESAKDVAGMFRYDTDKREQNERNVMNFSIEGAKIEKKGMDIVKSIARKVTVTVTPCNKAAVAEMVPVEQKKQKDDLDSIFKSENVIEIELFKNESTMKKGDVLAFPKKPSATGKLMGRTKSGKDVMSHAKIHDYKGFSAADHSDASTMHHAAAQSAPDHATASHHRQKMNLHNQALRTAERKDSRLKTGAKTRSENHPVNNPLAKANIYDQKGVHKPPVNDQKGGTSIMGLHVRNPSTAGTGSKEMARRHAQKALSETKAMPKPNLGKSMEAGSANVAPSQLTQGAALQKENIKMPKEEFLKEHKKLLNVLKHPSKKKLKEEIKEQGNELKEIKKSKWLVRANEAYSTWGKKEKFQSFMKSRFPNMTMGEIDAFGKTLALKKSIEAEKTLTKMVKSKCQCSNGKCNCK